MVMLAPGASDDESAKHWDSFSDVIIAGDVVHLVSKRKRGRPSKSSVPSSGDSSGGNNNNDDEGVVNGASIPDKPTTVLFIEQFLYKDKWDWSDQPDLEAALHDAIDRKDAVRIGILIFLKFERAGVSFNDFYFIVHDEDKSDPEWDEATSAYVRKPKGPHIHVVTRIATPTHGISPNQASGYLGIQPSQFEIPKSKRYGFENKMAYLIHIKYPHKHQYDPSRVVMLAGSCSYVKYYHDHLHAWEVGRAKKLAAIEEVTVDVDWLWDECFHGRVTEDNIYLTDSYRACYARHKKKLDDAMDSYIRSRIAHLVEDFDKGLFSTTFVYVQGPSRLGKSFQAECLIDALKARYGWELNDLASKNALDDYKGGDIILIDDAGAAAMDGKAWLNLIDPNTSHPAPARFKNKPRIAPRVVIITSTKDPLDFFYFASQLGGDRNEAMTQFIGRIIMSCVVFDYRDLRNQFTVPALDGSQVDASVYNMQLLMSHMTETPVRRTITTKSGRNHESHEEIIELEAELLPLREDGIELFYSPIGAMLEMVRRIEQYNPGVVTVHADESALVDAMGAKYLARIEKDKQKFGSSNLCLPDNYAALPECIAAPLTARGQADAAKAVEDERVRFEAEQEEIIAEVSKPTYALHDLPDYDELARKYRDVYVRDMSCRLHVLQDKSSPEYARYMALLTESSDFEHKAHDEAVKPVLRRRIRSRLSDLADDYFALRHTDADKKKVEVLADKPRFLLRAVRHWMRVSDQDFTFKVKSPLRASKNINSSRNVKCQPTDYDVLLAFADSYEGYYGEVPFDVEAFRLKKPDLSADDKARVLADEFMAKALAKRTEMKAMEDADAAIVVPEPSQEDVDYYVASHTKHLLVDVDAVEYGVVDDDFFHRIELRASISIS